MTRLLAVLAVMLAECTGITGAQLAFTPGSEWRSWYAEVEVCSGLRGDYDRITWVEVQDVRGYFTRDGQDVLGTWKAPHTIYVGTMVHPYPYTAKQIVSHEMLHDLLGSSDHPAPPFGRCAILS
jgi:hypothetical protein